MAITGAHIGWTSPTLPRLKGPESHLPISSNDASWIASFYLLGNLPGNVLAAVLVDWLGRKASLLLAGLPLTLGWLLVIFAWQPYVLYCSRFLSGLGQGLVYVVCPMYIGEIADKEIRGALGSFIKLMVTFGELYAHALGPFLSYAALGYSCLLLSGLFFLGFAWMPESPYFLVMRERRAEAARSLRWLRGPLEPELEPELEQELDQELDQMQKAVIRELSDRGRARDLLGNRRALLVCLGLQLVLQFSGLAAIESYTQEILEEGGDSEEAGFTPAMAVILLSVLQLAAGLGAAALVDRIGRRPLLVGTTLLAGLALGASGLFYLLKLRLGLDTRGYGSVLVASIIGYELVVALGLNPLAYMMLGELFPTNVKGLAVSLANLWASLLAFVVSKMHQVVADSLGIDVSFGWFAASCFLGLVFIVLCVPETKGKSLLEIQEELNCARGRRRPAKSKVLTAANPPPPPSSSIA
ncbi:facilitated trehalose transporter Tret1-like isoform X2 [Nasonia vitripennis]|nr:facilitated trehalose transporter Tret1-like isoform X2 [Nasonia vitripennis]